ncbi:TonB-dependent receptor [Altererythrobacter sp.]|uniref:TonB-dependent receptor n=1 Tax=Altererythrobacter sp. TaxID=1872480 RepID=UPI003D09ED71
MRIMGGMRACSVGMMALGVSLAVGQSANAEEAPPPSDPPQAGDVGVPEIIVTAQFRSQRLQDTPLAITALNSEMLQARNLASVTQVGEQAPNVTIKPAGAVYGPASQVFIRGIGQGDTNFALEPGVGVYIDDVYYSTVFGSIFDLVDIDRVEILRGPQGTLAGKNSIGGALKLFSRQPSNDFEGSVEANIGRFDKVGLRAAVNIPLVQDRLAMRLSGVARYSDGYITSLDYGCLNPTSGVPSFVTSKSCKLGSEGGQEYYGLRSVLQWTPGDDVTVTITGDLSIDKSEPGATILTHGENRGRFFLNGVPFDSRFETSGSYINYATYNDPGGIYTALTPVGPVVITRPPSAYALQRNNDLKDWGVSGVIDWRISDSLSLKSITAYRRYHGSFYNDADASPFNFQLVANDFKHWQLSQELRLSGRSFSDLLEWTIGGFYFKAKDTTGGRVYFPTVFDTLLDDPARPRSQSLFAHGTLHVTDKLNLTAGVRYSDERKTYIYNRTDPNTGLPPPALAAIDGVGAIYKGDRFDYKANIDYHFTDDVMVYGQFSTGFRSGGINPRPFFSNQVVPFEPESLNAFELGFKSSFLDRAITLNGAVFLNKYKNILLGTNNPYVNPNMPIDEDPTSPTYNPSAGTFPSAVVINGGKADIKGFELETVLRPVEGLSVDASVSYLDFQYKEISAAALSTGITLQSNRLFTPKWKWNAGAQYEFPLGSAGSITPRFDVYYQGSIFTGAVQNPYNTIDSYTLANAQITWSNEARDLDLVLSVSNLFDKYYYLNKFETVSISGIALGQPGRPREWQLTLRKRF